MGNKESSADIFINGLGNGVPENLDSFLHITLSILRILVVVHDYVNEKSRKVGQRKLIHRIDLAQLSNYEVQNGSSHSHSCILLSRIVNFYFLSFDFLQVLCNHNALFFALLQVLYQVYIIQNLSLRLCESL